MPFVYDESSTFHFFKPTSQAGRTTVCSEFSNCISFPETANLTSCFQKPPWSPSPATHLNFPLLPKGLPWWLSGKESACQCRRPWFNPWVRKIPWRRKWQPTLVFLPGKSHGQRSMAGYSPWDHRRVGHDLATKQQTTWLPSTISTTLSSLSSCQHLLRLLV